MADNENISTGLEIGEDIGLLKAKVDELEEVVRQMKIEIEGISSRFSWIDDDFKKLGERLDRLEADINELLSIELEEENEGEEMKEEESEEREETETEIEVPVETRQRRNKRRALFLW